MGMRERIFLVTGCGSIGRRHVENLLRLNAGAVIAHDVLPERRREMEKLFGVPTYADFEVALQSGVSVVFICNPTSAHLSTAIAALNADCDVFVEKPLSNTMDRLAELLETASRKNRKVFVGCNFRFEPRLRIAARLLREGKLGRIYSVAAEFGHSLPLWRPWQDYRQSYSASKALGGGIILDSYHEFDYLYWLLGPVDKVFCLSGNLGTLGIATEDAAVIAMQFASGALCQIRLDYLRQPYARSCSIIGEFGTLEWDFSSQCLRVYDSREASWTTYGAEYGADANQMYIDEMKHFLACLDGRDEPIASLQDAMDVQRVVSAATRSAESGVVEYSSESNDGREVSIQ
jgi:predicted dehydrogenase